MAGLVEQYQTSDTFQGIFQAAIQNGITMAQAAIQDGITFSRTMMANSLGQHGAAASRGTTENVTKGTAGGALDVKAGENTLTSQPDEAAANATQLAAGAKGASEVLTGDAFASKLANLEAAVGGLNTVTAQLQSTIMALVNKIPDVQAKTA